MNEKSSNEQISKTDPSRPDPDPSAAPGPHEPLHDDVRYLDNTEIDSFLDALDHNHDGLISYAELEAALDRVHDEIAPHPAPHNLHHASRDAADRHAFLRSLVGACPGPGSEVVDDRLLLPRAVFAERVRAWKVPSLKQEQADEAAHAAYMRSLPRWRRVRSWWDVHGPRYLFLGLVLAMQLAFGIWQLVKYLTVPQYRAAFGWGVVLAKTCAGLLYPTMFFLVLSMSRWFSTFARRSYHVARYVDFDLSQAFHVKISIIALVLATLHAIGHLTGSFVFGSKRDREPAVAAVLGPEAVPRPYVDYVRSRPGWSGLVALGLFYLLALMSMPQIRKRNYELFQLGHLLMFPIIALLCAHGTAALLQWPMLGYFLAFPTLLVLCERITRSFIFGFHPIRARLAVLDENTVELVAPVPDPRWRVWRYEAGQWVYLQVPALSRWQWHPFTVSVAEEGRVRLHIKTDGDWTGRLKALALGPGQGNGQGEGTEEAGIQAEIIIGLDGPYGAPAQRFYDFSHTVLVGSGIGVTPFSGILADLQRKDDALHLSSSSLSGEKQRGPWEPRSRSRSRSRSRPASGARSGLRPTPSDNSGDSDLTRAASRLSRVVTRLARPRFAPDYRRVDFHWMVRDRNQLRWLSDLLNDVSRSQAAHRAVLAEAPEADEAAPDEGRGEAPASTTHLDVRLYTHVTQRRADLTQHVYRWLLEMHRTAEHPCSPWTGLLNPTHFGRPDLVRIMDKHYDDLVGFVRDGAARQIQGRGRDREQEKEKDTDKRKGDAGTVRVGVFFCGAPVIGEVLADRCRLLTARAASEGLKVQYVFMTEVFD